MNFFAFLEEKILELIFQIFFLIFTVFLLFFCGVDSFYIFLLILLFVTIHLLFQFFLYRRKLKEYNKIIHLADSLEESYYIAEILKKPRDFQNAGYYYALKKACKAMNDKISEIMTEKQEYQEYVESFAHVSSHTCMHLKNQRSLARGTFHHALPDMFILQLL